MKQYGDVVTYLRNGVELEALVVQSTVDGEGRQARENLVVVYLDPAAKAILIRDMKKVVATAFGVVPFVDGASSGWKELKRSADDTTVIHRDGTIDGPAPLTRGNDLG